MENENSKEKETKQVLKELNSELIEKMNATTSQRERDNIEGIIPIYIGVIVMAMLFYCMSAKALFSLILCIFLISVFSIMVWGWMRHLEKTQKQKQDIEKSWQTKLIDAYGKLLENQIKTENKLTELTIKEIEFQIEKKGNKKTEDMKKKEEEEKKKKEEREADLDKKKHELEIAKLNYEIEKYKDKIKHINEED